MEKVRAGSKVRAAAAHLLRVVIAADTVQPDRGARGAGGVRQHAFGDEEVVLDIGDELLGDGGHVEDVAESRYGFVECLLSWRLLQAGVLARDGLKPGADAGGVQLRAAGAELGGDVRACRKEVRVESITWAEGFVPVDAPDRSTLLKRGHPRREDEVRLEVNDLLCGWIIGCRERDRLVRFGIARPDRIDLVGRVTLANDIVLQTHRKHELGCAMVHADNFTRGVLNHLRHAAVRVRVRVDALETRSAGHEHAQAQQDRPTLHGREEDGGAIVRAEACTILQVLHASATCTPLASSSQKITQVSPNEARPRSSCFTVSRKKSSVLFSRCAPYVPTARDRAGARRLARRAEQPEGAGCLR